MKICFFTFFIFFGYQTFAQEKLSLELQKKYVEKNIKIKLFEEYLGVIFEEDFPQYLNNFLEATFTIDTLKSMGFPSDILFLSVKCVINKEGERILPPYIFSSAPAKCFGYVFAIFSSEFEYYSPFFSFSSIYRISGFSKHRNEFKKLLDGVVSDKIWYSNSKRKIIKNHRNKKYFLENYFIEGVNMSCIFDCLINDKNLLDRAKRCWCLCDNN